MSVSAYQNRLKAIRLHTAAQVSAEWDRLPNLDQTHAAPFARRAATIVAAGQLLTAKTANAYLGRLPGVQPARIAPANVTGEAARKGVHPLDEYQRPFGVAWHELSNGAEFDQARKMGRNRLNVLAVADVWLAMRVATELVDAANTKITGWVRVADSGACDLCSAADGQPMDQAADMAGHPGCGCTSAPTFADSPPSQASDPEATDVHEHDELGPVLYEAGQHFTAA